MTMTALPAATTVTGSSIAITRSPSPRLPMGPVKPSQRASGARTCRGRAGPARSPTQLFPSWRFKPRLASTPKGAGPWYSRTPAKGTDPIPPRDWPTATSTGRCIPAVPTSCSPTAASGSSRNSSASPSSSRSRPKPVARYCRQISFDDRKIHTKKISRQSAKPQSINDANDANQATNRKRCIGRYEPALCCVECRSRRSLRIVVPRISV